MAVGSSADRANNPEKVDYGPQRSPIVRSAGGTPSEQYLAKLGDRSFLNLWSFSNTFIDKKSGGKGDGKELCDLLVICGDHVLIFSDKTINWPSEGDEKLAWKRWYKRAILKSVDQIRGAERWIAQFPDKIFLDRQCTQPLPLRLPPPERRKVHGIVVALGAGDACKKHFGEGIGSLFISPAIKGDAHWKDENVVPFALGDVDPDSPFVHVLDDATLDIVMREFDTIVDFTAYLSKREQIIRSGKLIAAPGEEELVAYYMMHMNPLGEHDFTKPDGTTIGEDDYFSIATGWYEKLLTSEQYRMKKSADRNSYVWDRLIETFTTNMLAGTTIVPDGQAFIISELEEGIRHMALVPRYMRRVLGDAILDALQEGRSRPRFTRGLMPGPTERDQTTGFFFMTLAVPTFELDGGYDQYRAVRRNLLEAYALAFLQKHPVLKRVVGIGTEPMNNAAESGSSEDLIVVQVDEWTPKLLQDLDDRKKRLNIFEQGKYKEYAVQGNEYPEVTQEPTRKSSPKLSRRQRRAQAAEARRRRKGGKQQ
jgi:hypothetical protein